MSVEYLPSGIACNLKCRYCYQDDMRDAGNISAPANFISVKAILEKKKHFALFGGEPLLTPISQLKELFAIGKDHSNNIQTNGLLITEEHIQLFKDYKVHVGVSIDGNGRMNSPRCSDEETRQIINNIIALRKHDIAVSIIITIHKANSNIDDLRMFVYFLASIGIKYVNFHVLEVDKPEVREELALTNLENFLIFSQLYHICEEAGIIGSPFNDLVNLLTNTGQSNCIWNACDPANTQAVYGIGPDGGLINCGRTNKTGVNWVKADDTGHERQFALFNTPQEYNGCKDCKYFFACKGNCPGTAVDRDWRNRTEHCEFWFDLLAFVEDHLARERELVVDHAARNQAYVNLLTRGPNSHGDIPHGDSPHGDSHGDHSDAAIIGR
jgi:uncharacterized protein